jgi:hypothetical protein
LDDRKCWDALPVLCLIAVASIAACSQSHDDGGPTPELGDAAIGSEPALDPGAVDAEVEQSSLERACPLTAEFAGSLADVCADPSLNETPCQAGEPMCVSYLDRSASALPPELCIASCELDGDFHKWSIGCGNGCNHACAAPAPDLDVVDLDTSDCAQRRITACPTGNITVQGQLDDVLRQLVRDNNVSLRDVYNDGLVVRFERGCPVSFHARAKRGPLAELAQVLPPVLTEMRWDCAMQLTCADIEGPSLIQ